MDQGLRDQNKECYRGGKRLASTLVLKTTTLWQDWITSFQDKQFYNATQYPMDHFIDVGQNCNSSCFSLKQNEVFTDQILPVNGKMVYSDA